jgi:anaerobic magnesium-protoporphyrin IX monomethyl ester cyclase
VLPSDLCRDANCDVLLINPPYPRRYGGGIVPPIGLCYLAASLRRYGAEPRILDLAATLPWYNFDQREEPTSILRAYLRGSTDGRPKLIGIGPLVTATLEATRDLIQTCREEIDTPIVVGGPLCSVPGFGCVNDRFLRVDAYVAGDGETPVSSIWRAIASQSPMSNLAGVGVLGGSEPQPFREIDLDTLPIPARDLLIQESYLSSARRDMGSKCMTAAFLSRGCPYSCSFCAAPLSSGKTVRRLSAERISTEISACSQAGFADIIFYDDCLFIRSPHLNERVLEFANAIKTANWHGTFQLELRCDAVTGLSDEALAALIDVGCRQINMGIEKAQVSQLQEFRKKLSPETARAACERLSRTMVRSAGTFILGGPNEQQEDIDATIDFALSLPLDFAHFNPLAIYPGTALYSRIFGAIDRGNWLDTCLDRQMAPMGDILWRSSDLPLDKIFDGILRGYHDFYTQERLKRVAGRFPDAEKTILKDAYKVLLEQRPRSWIQRNAGESKSLTSIVTPPC